MEDFLATQRLAVVCPMANERASAIEFVKQVLERAEPFKETRFFAVLDRVSKDGTLELLREFAEIEPRLTVLWAPENRCVVDAYLAGYRKAIESGHEWILEIDAGFSHQPSDLPRFLEKVRPDVDCLFGTRFGRGGSITDTSLKRRILSRGGSILANLLLGTRLSDMTSGYEIFSHEALREVLGKGIHSKGHFFQTEIKVHCRNMRIEEVPIHYRAASDSVNSGVIRDSFRNLFRLAFKRVSGSLD